MSQQRQLKPSRRNSVYTLSSIDKLPPKQQTIPSLYSKFLTISNKIEIQHNVSNLNIIEEDTAEIKPFNDKLHGVKLKQIQNKNQLLKVEAQLFKQRRLSRIRQAQHRATASAQIQNLATPLTPTLDQQLQVNPNSNPSSMVNPFEDNSKKPMSGPQLAIPIIQNPIPIAQTATKQRKNSNFSNSDFPQQQFEQVDDKCQGILYFNQLKKHPKILTYTIERSKQKIAHRQQQANNLMIKSKAFAQQFRSYCHSGLDIRQPAKTISVQLNPAQIVEKNMRKIYSKHMPKRIGKQVSNGLNDFIQQQKKILDSRSKKRLPKQAYSKLKQRLDSIAYEINACRRRNGSSYQIRSKSMMSYRQYQ